MLILNLDSKKSGIEHQYSDEPISDTRLIYNDERHQNTKQMH